MAENRCESWTAFLSNEQRRLLVASENLLHSALVLETVNDRLWQQEREIDEHSGVIGAITRPRRDIRVAEDRERCSKEVKRAKNESDELFQDSKNLLRFVIPKTRMKERLQQLYIQLGGSNVAVAVVNTQSFATSKDIRRLQFSRQ